MWPGKSCPAMPCWTLMALTLCHHCRPPPVRKRHERPGRLPLHQRRPARRRHLYRLLPRTRRRGHLPGGRGAETYCYDKNGAGGRLAQAIQNQLVASLSPFDQGYKDRGVKAHPSFCVLRHTTMPAVLVETGFIDSEDVGILTLHGEDIARAIARGVMDYGQDI
ncbi:N-acetylmuramoyl-L-alanine amidase family protein [Selenomonas ruminantium]|uniref:N-acetylmuramoyl-L-alanine amidase family protein n=1 Tax=Selenomonas ruminantium TaxID=971 RepID=UPI0035320AB0